MGGYYGYTVCVCGGWGYYGRNVLTVKISLQINLHVTSIVTSIVSCSLTLNIGSLIAAFLFVFVTSTRGHLLAVVVGDKVGMVTELTQRHQSRKHLHIHSYNVLLLKAGHTPSPPVSSRPMLAPPQVPSGSHCIPHVGSL